MNRRKVKRSVLEIKTLFRKEVVDVDLYQVKGDSCPIKLNQNESPFRPEEVEEGIQTDLLAPPLNRYPDERATRLRRSLADHLGWPEEGIAVANGSNVLVQALIIATAVNEKVLSVVPTFPLYRLEAKILGNRMLEVPLGRDFSLPLKNFLSVLKREKPKIILLANPNAPTGTLFPEETILQIIRNAKCLVVLDEAYFPFSKQTYFSYLKNHPHLVILRTFSKSMSLAGLRLGYMLGHPEVVQQVEKILLPFRLSQLVQILGIRGLKYSEKSSVKTIEIIDEKERVFKILRDLKDIEVFPSAANFLLFRIKSPLSGAKVFQALMEKGILIRDFSKYPRLKECLRVTIGHRRENDSFLAALKGILHASQP